MDPRISDRFVKATPSDQFIGTAMLAIMDHLGIADETLADLNKGTGPNWTAIVGGRPLHEVNGKSPKKLREEGMKVKDIDAVQRHLKSFNLSLPEDPVYTPPPEKRKATTEPPVTDPVAGQQVSSGAVGSENPPAEPHFANRPVYELALLSDADLLKIEGIGPDTIRQIREWAVQHPAKLPDPVK